MRLLGRLVLVGLALLLAIPVGGTALLLGLFLDPLVAAWLTERALDGLDTVLSEPGGSLPAESLVLLAAGLAKVSFELLVLPPVLIAGIGETLRLRGLLWYGAACGGLTALLPWLGHGTVGWSGETEARAAAARIAAILFVAGASAGLTYWLVAGRSAGEPAR